jgi:hypothetical protein
MAIEFGGFSNASGCPATVTWVLWLAVDLGVDVKIEVGGGEVGRSGADGVVEGVKPSLELEAGSWQLAPFFPLVVVACQFRRL